MDVSASLAAAKLVALMYEGALDAGQLIPMLRALAECLGADAAQWHIRSLPQWAPRASTTVLHDGSAAGDFDDAYLQGGGRADPLVALLRESAWRQVHRHEQPPVFLQGRTLAWTLGAAFPHGPQRAAVLTLYRRAEAPPFDPHAEDLLAGLLPYLERAWTGAARLERRHSALRIAADALRQVPVACVVTDGSGRCLESSECFRSLPQPLPFQLVMGRLRFTQADWQSRWEQALRTVEATGVGCTIAALGSADDPWTVTLKPLADDSGAAVPRDTAMLALFTCGHALAAGPLHRLESRSKLTRAEQEVMAGLLKGLQAKTIALYRGASVHTVRSQIMAILEKTGYSSQKELIASFASSNFQDSAFARAGKPSSTDRP